MGHRTQVEIFQNYILQHKHTTISGMKMGTQFETTFASVTVVGTLPAAARHIQCLSSQN